MYRSICVIFLTFTFVVIPVVSYSAEKVKIIDKNWIDEDFGEVDVSNLYSKKEREQKKESKFGKWWSKNARGSIGTSNSVDQNGSTISTSFVKVDYKEELTDWLEVGSQLLAQSTNVRMVHKLKSGCTDCEGLPDQITFTYNQDRFEPFTFYGNFKISNNLKLKLGQDIVTWGQFEPFSPINTVFPINLTPYSFDLTKQSTTLPQLHVNLSIYPTKRIRWDNYYFPRLQMHDILQNGKIDNNYDQYAVPVSDGFGGVTSSLSPIVVQKPRDESSWGSRVMYYGDDVIFGFSYYNGWNVNQLSYFNTLETATVEGLDVDYVKKKIGFAKQIAYAVEMNYKYGKKWEFISEVMLQANKERLKYYSGVYQNLDAYNSYTNWIRNDNGGNIYISKKQLVSGIGFRYKGDRLHSDFALFNLTEIYDKNAKTGLRLQKATYTKKNHELPVYPVFDIGYYIDSSKYKEVGFSAGVLGYGYGAGVYYSHKLTDNLKYKLSARGIKYFFDDLVDAPQYEGKYENKASVSKAVAIQLMYDF